MVIWLRNPQAEGPAAGLGAGIADDVLRGDDLKMLVDIDNGYADVQQQCDTALEAAHAEAQAIVEAAQAQAEALVAQAREAYEGAARRGYEDGTMQALSEWQERALHAHAHAQTLGRQRRDRLAELVALAAEQIVATSDPAALFARAAKAIEHIVADSSPVHLRVHPADLAAARSAFDEAALGWRETGRAVRLLVNADATLEPGACVIETDLGALDASLSLQLAAMREAVARAVRSVPEEDFAGDEAAADAGGHAYGEDVPDFEHAGDDEAQATADVAGDPYATTTNEDADYAGYAGEGDEVEASLLAV